jgi:hypothetical protein
MKVAIIYGWAEGSWQGKRMRKLLRSQGYHITKNAKEADVIIAHSGGCYMLPEQSRAQQVILIGLPYWPDKHPLISLREKLRQELKDTWWYKKTLFNTYYLLSRPRRWVRMSRAFKQRVVPAYESCSIYLVRNEQDSFLHPQKVVEVADAHEWQLKLVDGLHDDLWLNPERYIELIRQ